MLDSGQGVHGLLKITDTSVLNPTTQAPQVTEYYRDSGIVKKRTYWSVRPNQTPSYTFNGSAGGAARTATYTPVSGYRYYWQTGQNFTLRTSTTYANSEWLGIDALAKDPGNIVDGPNRENLDAVPLREGEYIQYDPTITDDYTYGFKQVDVGTPTTISDPWTTSTWYGTTTYYVKDTVTQDKKDIHTHSVRANRDIAIEFTGYDANNANVNVTVNSPNSSVLISNGIHNPQGWTSITAGGQIQELNAEATVGGHSITLAAQTGIGGANTLRTDLTDGDGGVLNATTTSGNIKLAEISGELKINQVTTSSTNGDVTLTSQQDIMPSGSGNLVRGGAISLTATYGAIGTLGAGGKASATGVGALALNLSSGTTPRDKVTVVASNNVYLAEAGTDMQINSIAAGGDVRIEAPNGNVIDDNSAEVTDDRTAAQLLALYDRMMATASTVGQSLADTTAAFEGLRTRDYMAYWQYRNGQTSDYVGGLTHGQTYYVVGVSGNLISLASSAGGKPISVTASAVSGAEHRLYKAGSATALTFNSVTDVSSANGTIQLAAGNGLSIGNAVTYYRVVEYNAGYHVTLTGAQRDAFVAYFTTQGTTQGLSGADLTAYVNNAITTLENKQTQEYHTLNETYGVVGNALNPGSMGYDANIYDPSFAYSVTAVALHGRFGSTAVNAATDSISVGPNVFTSGQAVTYHNGGGTSIPGLVNGTIYYVVKAAGDATHIKLAATQADANASTPVVINLSAGGTGTGHYFADGDDLLQRAAWSTSQLQNSVSAGILRPKTVSSTSSTIEEPNISGHDIAIVTASGSIGVTGDPIDILLPLSGGLTNAQKLALAGAERQDVTFYSDLAGTIEIAPDDLTQTAKLVRVAVTKDVDLSSTGLISASAGVNANLGSELDMTLDQVSAVGEVRIKSRLNLINGRTAAGPNVKGGDIILEAGTASIGTSAKPLLVEVTSGKKLTARASNDIYIVGHGDMALGEVFCMNIADLRSDGSILDGYDDDVTTADWNVNAKSIYLEAGVNGTIGAAGNFVEINQQVGQPLKALAGQSIFLAEVSGDMLLDEVTSTHGDVSLTADVSILDADSSVTADIQGNSITLRATNGAIGSGSHDLMVDSQYSTSGSTHALTSFSAFNTYISELSGSLYLNTVTVDAGTAFIAAPVGSILNSNLSPSNVLSGKTYLFASQNIGAAGNPVSTTVGRIEGVSTAGSTWISNIGGLTVGGVTPNASGMVAGGAIYLSADSPVTVDKDMIAYDEVVIAAVDDSPGDDLTVLGGFTVQSTHSYVRLLAGDNLIIQPTAIVLAADYVELYVDWQGDESGNPPAPGHVNADAPGGVANITGTVNSPVRIDMRGDDQADTFNIWGHITAPDVNVYGQGGDDAISLNPANGSGYVLDLDGHVHVFGGDGDDTVTANRLATLTTAHSGQRDTIDIDGGEGSDNVVVNTTGGVTDYIVNCFDTGVTGTDTLTIEGTGQADNFLLRASKNDYPEGVAFVASLHGDPLSNVERVNYNKSIEQLTVDGNDGDDQFTLDDNWAATALNGGDGQDHFQVGQIFKSLRDAAAGVAPADVFDTTLTTRGYISNGISYETSIYGDVGNDDFVVFHNAAALHLFGGADDDSFTIRAFALEGSHATDVSGQGGNDFVQYVLNAPVDIDGGTGNNTVRIIGTEFSDQFVITNSSVYGAGLSLSNYVNISTLEIDSAEGNDTFYVVSTSISTVTKLYGGLGSDRFVIGGDIPDVLSGSTIIYPATAGPHVTSGIAGELILDGGPLNGTAGGLGTPVMLPGETNVLPPSGAVLAYTGTGAPATTDTMVVPTASLDAVRTALGLANLSDLIGQTVEISSGPGLGRFWLITALAVDGSDSTRTTLSLKNPAEGAAEWGLPDSSSEFAITHLSSNFFVTESEQVDFASIYNDQSNTDDTGALTATQITGLNMGASGIAYGNFEGLDIFLGAGNDTFDVNSTMKRSDGFQTVTMLSAGGGDDVVTVTLDADADGFFSVNGEAGNDTIDASASTLPLVIFGGAGDDTISGGTARDIIFGDNGQVDYRDSVGTLITRLGLDLSTRNVLQPGQAETSQVDVPFMQTDGIARGPSLAATRDAASGGNDTIVGNIGNDIIFGGAGNDFIGFDSGGTPLGAEAGSDIIIGDNGNVLFDSAGAGIVQQAQATDPTVAGDDTIHGGQGDDLIFGGAGNDSLFGDSGNDKIVGDNGSAQFDASGQLMSIQTDDPSAGGADTIHGGNGGDVILGGAGGDNVSGDTGNDFILGDDGLVQFAADGLVTSIQTTDFADGGGDTIYGGDGDDLVIGGSAGDSLHGDNGATATGGNDVLIGDQGQASFADGLPIEIVSTDTATADGGVDTIHGDGGDDIIIGGADGDLLYGDDGQDILLGDAGQIQYLGAIVTMIQTTDSNLGGNDTVSGGEGNDVILGGAGDDDLSGNAGDDVILGDDGRCDYGLTSDAIENRADISQVALSGTAGVLDRIVSTDTNDGGDDTIYGNGGNDILLGGTGDDTVYGDDGAAPALRAGSDIVLGDFAAIYPNLPWASTYFAIDTGDGVGAGNDTLYAGGGDSILMGEQGDDQLHGGPGDDDMTGGSNVLTAVDGNDSMDGGSGADVMLGDNGMIARSLAAPVAANDWPAEGFHVPQWETWPAPFADLKRDVFLFDVIDGVGGDDTMHGGAGADILYGQRGDDTMYGDDGSDEVIGGLGDDEMHGGAGADFMLGDQGYFVRAVNEDGSARLNSDGSFHRDCVLEDVGTITGMVALDQTSLRQFDPQLAAKIMQADMVLVTGAFGADGAKYLNPDNQAWQTDALLVDLVGANDDTMDGGDDGDFIVGQRGDDTLTGGDGHDVLIGDQAVNATYFDTDLPQVVQAIRLVSEDPSVPVTLEPLGSVVIPKITSAPQELSGMGMPAITGLVNLLPGYVHQDVESSLPTTDGLGLVPYMAIIPDTTHHVDLLAGNDTISGGDGDDLIVGDNLTVYSPLKTGFAVLDARMSSVTDQLSYVTDALHQLSLDYDLYEHEVLNETDTCDLHIGENTLNGDSGNDTIIGNNGTIATPFTTSLPTAATDLAPAAVEFFNLLSDMQYLSVDFGFVVQEAHLQALNDLANDAVANNPTHAVTKARDLHDPGYHVLHIDNDVINGGSGNDILLGDDAMFFTPLITGQTYASPAKFLNVSSALLKSTQKTLIRLRAERNKELARHVKADHAKAADFRKRLPTTRDLYLATFGYEYSRYIGNDTIIGGDGNKLIEGDTALLTMPILPDTPTSPAEAARDGRNARVVSGVIKAYVNNLTSPHGSKNYFAKQFHDTRRAGGDKIVLSLSKDTIVGGTGTNYIMGGSLFLTVPFNADGPEELVKLGYMNMVDYDFQAKRRACLGQDLSGQHVKVDFAADAITANGTDNLVYGGSGANVITSGPGTNVIRIVSSNVPGPKVSLLMQQFVLSSLSSALQTHWQNLAATSTFDLTGTFGTTWSMPASALAGKPVAGAVSVVVSNVGNTWLPLGQQVQIQLVAYDPDGVEPDITLATLPKGSVSSLLGNGSKTFSIHVNASLPAGSYQIKAIITPVQLLDESRPDNNDVRTNAKGEVFNLVVT